MSYRAAKNDNGVIICIGNDESQSGNYPVGVSDDDRLGVWCDWTFDEFPPFAPIDGVDDKAMRFKENATADGLEVRPDSEVIDSPNG
jgi:hypothetical protein